MSASIKAIAHEMKVQDCRATSHPFYCVEVLRDGVWHYKTGCFTAAAAERWIAFNEHNYEDGQLRIYVRSFYDNPEMIAVQAFVKEGGAR